MTTTAPIPPITGTVTITVPIEQASVLFAANGPHETTVGIEHRHLDRIDGGQAINNAIRGGGGWKLLLAAFAEAVAAQQ